MHYKVTHTQGVSVVEANDFELLSTGARFTTDGGKFVAYFSHVISIERMLEKDVVEVPSGFSVVDTYGVKTIVPIKTLDCVGSESCKATTETIKP